MQFLEQFVLRWRRPVVPLQNEDNANVFLLHHTEPLTWSLHVASIKVARAEPQAELPIPNPNPRAKHGVFVAANSASPSLDRTSA